MKKRTFCFIAIFAVGVLSLYGGRERSDCGVGVEAGAGFPVSDARSGWVLDSIARGCVWYKYMGFYAPFNSEQTVNVVGIDLSTDEYRMVVRHSEKRDSLSAFATREGAFAGINGSYYEPDVSFVRTQGKTWREVAVDESHVRFWKHAGALFYNDSTRMAAIGYGSNREYRNSPFTTVLSGAPMLIYDYKPVGTEFTGDMTGVDIKSLDYEDYRRHQGVRHPRVAIALTGDNKLLLVAVDGRWKSSAGMSAAELTLFLQRFFNPRYALNLDGGGSTTMWIKGRGAEANNVVNFPTDNKRYDHYGQRAVNNVILIKKETAGDVR